MSIFFKDLGKKAKDLLGKNYTSDGSKKFSIKTKTAGGVTYAAESAINGAKAKGKVKVDFKNGQVKFKNLSLDSSGCFETDIAVSDVLDNVVFTLRGKSKSLSSHTGDIGAEYSTQDFKAKIVVAPVCKNNAQASVCFKQDDFFAGASAGVDFGEGFNLSSYDFGVGYSFDSDNSATLHVANQLSTVKLSGYRKHSSDINLAGTITSSLGGDSFLPGVELGGSLEIDSETEVFGKLSAPNFGTKDLKASFALEQKLNSNAKLSLTSVIDLDPDHPQNFAGATFGLTLKFGA